MRDAGRKNTRQKKKHRREFVLEGEEKRIISTVQLNFNQAASCGVLVRES